MSDFPMDGRKRNALDGPPDEAMLEILTRATFRSVCTMKCVARAWLDLIDDPLNRRRLPQTLQGFFHMFPPMCYRDGSDLDHFFLKYLESAVPMDMDPCLSFLMTLPETETVNFLDSCNGLLLFEHCLKSDTYHLLSYVVCNPATKHWGTVPICARCLPLQGFKIVYTYLAFDPAVSSHFHLIQFWKRCDEKASIFQLSVHTYSSETGVWSHNQSDGIEQDRLEAWRHGIGNACGDRPTFLNGNLHLVVFHSGQERIVAVDVQGKTKRIITMPAVAKGRHWHFSHYIGQSQGRLHYINGDRDPHELYSYELTIWVLQDYDTQKWVLKDTVSFLKLFGRRTLGWQAFRIVAIHPDRNVVFFLYSLERLIVYDMDLKKVSIVSMLSGRFNREIVPYIPYFSESPALTNKN